MRLGRLKLDHKKTGTLISGEQADHVDGSDSEKLDLKLTDLHVFDQSEDNKPSPAEDSESKTTTSNGSADQMTSDP